MFVSCIALFQWLFFALFYERFIEHPIQQFIDLCSTCNISMLVLESDVYGYYIHGRSVHGRADTGLRQMHENIAREEVRNLLVATAYLVNHGLQAAWSPTQKLQKTQDPNNPKETSMSVFLIVVLPPGESR